MVYRRCLDEGLFGLDAPGRGPGPEPELDRSVHVVARLRVHLADLIAGADDPMAALLHELFTPPARFAHAGAWRALDVTQRVDDLGLSLG